MKTITAIVFALAFGSTARSQPGPLSRAAAQSVSGQFTVFSQQTPLSKSQQDLKVDTNHVILNPTLLVVTCERTKQALWGELGIGGAWEGRVTIALNHDAGADEEIPVVSERFKGIWTYRIELPVVVERTRLVRALVNVLLQELANRNAGERPSEIPVWLTEGLTQDLLASRGAEIILTSPTLSVNGLTISRPLATVRQSDPLQAARNSLRGLPPLTLNELSWPTEDHLTGTASAVYRNSAQLFVSELLRFKDGRPCMRAMLGELSQCYNWQTAFLRGFRAHFKSPLDVEKWWSLQAVHFTGRDPGQTWSPGESWARLNDLLLTPIEIRHSLDQLPGHSTVPLARVIGEWNFTKQSRTLKGKIHDLEIARIRVSPKLVGLVSEYRDLLATYLARRSKGGFFSPSTESVVRDTLEQLDLLEQKRQALRSEPGAVSSVNVGPDPTVNP